MIRINERVNQRVKNCYINRQIYKPPTIQATFMKQLAIGLAVLLIILSGCVSEPPRLKNVVEDTGFPVTLADNHGRNITIEKVPERIVSLAPSNTEILFALGLGE